jgi:S1-C subfamily serine protease
MSTHSRKHSIEVLSYSFLDQFVVEFDRVHDRVDFQCLFGGTHFAVPGEITAGFYISYRQPGRRVSDVLRGLAADSQGMRPGDPIVSINGRIAASFSYRQWEELLRVGRTIQVAWLHDGQSHIFRFPVVELH